MRKLLIIALVVILALAGLCVYQALQKDTTFTDEELKWAYELSSSEVARVPSRADVEDLEPGMKFYEALSLLGTPSKYIPVSYSGKVGQGERSYEWILDDGSTLKMTFVYYEDAEALREKRVKGTDPEDDNSSELLKEYLNMVAFGASLTSEGNSEVLFPVVEE